MRAELGGFSGQQEVKGIHYRSVSTRRPFREDLQSAARLIDPAPPVTNPPLHLSPCFSFLWQAQWRPIFLWTSHPRRLRPCVFIFFFPPTGATCVAKKRSGVEQRHKNQPVTPSTLCLVTSGSSLPGCEGINRSLTLSVFFWKICSKFCPFPRDVRRVKKRFFFLRVMTPPVRCVIFPTLKSNSASYFVSQLETAG